MKDKVVVITGGSSGIGKALAEVFGSRGSKILITGRKKGPLDEAVAELKAKDIEITGFQSDVSKEEDNESMAKEAIRQFGKIDILINNAGISMRALFEDVDLEVVKQVMDINFYGALYATKYCLPSIMDNKGSVIGISSIAGFRGLPGRTGYSASKFALQGFLEVLRTEMLKKGVHVLTACPGFTASNIRKSSLTADGSQQGESPRQENKMMTAEECALHIYKATKKRKKYLVLTGQGKMTVFLNKWFPGFMDKIVYNVMAKEENSPLR
ncbi:short-chain dehydrogenase/reductase SDR [Fulvivirga imtechensis AK7]|uniref:Short-chain dehydrogenase/reductase SDR n=1 Tax=Fulvivirga imtechensis AK7 TaxID=1237149 RepID=L8JUM3_9BACT|nr:SDR family oxidoreductase [Fulvivirga imtechensis]ELR71239.1 short-chain dehydrogenase/reductase SDR [Fulvivirga imtechensis AK7]